ncbi:Uncharacterized protein dnl_47180 [Desulfonema limicola]|uniref:Uncharacterized protein n=1 Tax=Desulfonema limicola TaxID=45656 RepID=A0A975BBS4_9BACT|nr:hypothetical protein [Desulfonema limicola]QTA82344.1 Uncharacterized protein dnl_47180 [Desulfonema limicola]
MKVSDKLFDFECENCGKKYNYAQFVDVVKLWGLIYLENKEFVLVGITCPEENCNHTTIKKLPPSKCRIVKNLIYNSTKIENLIKKSNSMNDFSYLDVPPFYKYQTNFRATSPFSIHYLNQLSLTYVSDRELSKNESGIYKIPHNINQINNDINYSVAEENIKISLEIENFEGKYKALPRVYPFYSPYDFGDQLFKCPKPTKEEPQLQKRYIYRIFKSWIAFECKDKKRRYFLKKSPYKHLIKEDMDIVDLDLTTIYCHNKAFLRNVQNIINQYSKLRNQKDFELIYRNEFLKTIVDDIFSKTSNSISDFELDEYACQVDNMDFAIDVTKPYSPIMDKVASKSINWFKNLFECNYCNQIFQEETISLSTFLYGIIILSGEKDGYFGLTCPNCLKTNIIRKSNSQLKNLIKKIQFCISSEDCHPIQLDLRYYTPYNFALNLEPDFKNFDANGNIGGSPPTNDNERLERSESILIHMTEEEPESFEGRYCSYIFFSEPLMPPLESFFGVFWYTKTQIEDYVRIENREQIKLFPRYIHYVPLYDKIELFIWEKYSRKMWADYKLKKNQELITFVKKKALSLGKEFSEITDVNYFNTQESAWGQISETSQEEFEKNYHKIPYEFMEILADFSFLDKLDQIFRKENIIKLKYFFWKNKFPFKDIGVPIPLNDIDKSIYEQAYKINDLKNDIAERIKPHIGKQYFNDFMYDQYMNFIKDYCKLSITPYFSFADIWELQIRYLTLLDKHIEKESRKEANYVFIREGKGWTIVFNSKRSVAFRGKGFGYLYFLVKNKHKKCKMEDLENFVLSEKELPSSTSGKYYDPDISHNSTSQKILDDSAIEAYKKEIKRLKQELKEAKENNDIERKTIIEKEIKLYSSDLNVDKKSKKFTDAHKRMKDRIGKAIKRAIETIEKSDANLANHFDDSLSQKMYSDGIDYSPKPDIDWQV